MERAHIIVHGLVQGVFFRVSTAKAAKKLGLKGYARNLADGTVEVVAEGPKEKLNGIIEYCKKGPENARVEKTETKFEKAKDEFDGFDVKH